MIKLFYKLFNHDKINDMQRTIDIYKERNSQLEKENREYKGYKLKYEVTKLYVEDDEALLELFDVAEKHETEIRNNQSCQSQFLRMAAQQQMNASGHGLLGGSYGAFTLQGIAQASALSNLK